MNGISLCGFTTRLALSEARDVADLLLVREPEQRLKQELDNAGFVVRVYDGTDSRSSPYDIESLRIRFSVGPRGNSIDVRFDPVGSNFSWPAGTLSWKDFMFDPEKLLEPLRMILKVNSLA